MINKSTTPDTDTWSDIIAAGVLVCVNTIKKYTYYYNNYFIFICDVSLLSNYKKVQNKINKRTKIALDSPFFSFN